MTELDAIPVTTLAGRDTTLAEWDGKAKLVVNVASRCGLAPQYEKLEKLQKEYADRGFTVIGFPSNQFLQELGDNEKIAEYCSATWGVTFPMFEKLNVKGAKQHPLYKELSEAKTAEGKGGNVKWNFEKFLISREGEVIGRWRSKVTPQDPELVAALEKALG